jgi:hypothetical protein
MKRMIPMAAMLIALSTLTISGAKPVGAASTPPHRIQPARSPAKVAGTPVTVDSTWTFYEVDNDIRKFCSVISFGSSKIFSDDQRDAGRWTGTTTSIKIKFVNVSFPISFSFKGSWVSADGYWDGNITEPDGSLSGPDVLVAGVDPFGWGFC